MKRGYTVIKLICWNIAHRKAAWQCLVENEINADIALLQEAKEPPEDERKQLKKDPGAFYDAKTGKGLSRCAIVQLTDRVDVEYLTPIPLCRVRDGDFKTTHPGSLAAAIVKPVNGEPQFTPFIAVSICAEYEQPRCSAWDVTDASVQRVISDLSLFIGKQIGHRIIAAGDLSVYHGYGEDRSGYWKGRYDTVFDRMKALGLPFVGPQYPHGRQACPWPGFLPKDSKNVPTYLHPTQTPETAEHQLDYVFASESMVDSVMVRALNYPNQWKKSVSDHCRIEIEVE